jgi:hypothetical protein
MASRASIGLSVTRPGSAGLETCSTDMERGCSGLCAAEAAMTEQLAIRMIAAATVLKRS